MELHEETVKQLKEMISYLAHLETITTDKARKDKYLKMKLNIIQICEFFAIRLNNL